MAFRVTNGNRMRLSCPKSIGFLVLGLSVLLISGCGGCTPKNKAAQKGKNKTKKKPDFEHLSSAILPGPFPIKKPEIVEDKDENLAQQKAYDKANLRFLEKRTKRGHWFATSTPVVANNFDRAGILRSRIVDGGNRPLSVANSNYSLSVARPFSLAKGEWKYLEHMEYAPLDGNFYYDIQLETESGGSIYGISPTQKHLSLKPYQFHFVILSNKPDSYRYLNASDSIFIDDETGQAPIKFYELEFFKVGERAPLPSNALAWTTTAYLLWDDFQPDQLSSDQQVALVDWLHFGGQLILSGPDAADKLKNSFLSQYLPSKSNKARNLTPSDFAELNRQWSLKKNSTPIQDVSIKVAVGTSVIGIDMELTPSANFVNGTGSLVAEKRVGRGRIVMTSFSLDDGPFRKWRSVNSFINGCLLRRPQRNFVDNRFDMRTVDLNQGMGSIFDPLVNSTVRFVSRDLGDSGTQPTHVGSELSKDSSDFSMGFQPELKPEAFMFSDSHHANRLSKADPWRFGGFDDSRSSGVAGWNDSSAVSNAARTTLSKASGIDPPSADFVLKLLAGYLIVLVPINWLVFRLIGRVEWAWIAAPLIAVAGSVVVVKMASLDIGFIRSNNQLALVETFGNFNRAHVTEYSAVYTSLSTGYNVEFDTPNAQSLPFETNSKTRKRVEKEITLNRSISSRIENFQVDSNTTRLLHTEYMADLGGSIQFDPQTKMIRNTTRYDLTNVLVFRSTPERELEYFQHGNLESEDSFSIESWTEIDPNSISKFWNNKKPNFDINTIWNSNSDRQLAIEFQNLEPFRNKKSLFNYWTRTILNESGMPVAPETPMEEVLVTKPILQKIVDSFFESQSDIELSTNKMASTIATLLELEPGEYRLLAQMDRPVGSTTFFPKATRSTAKTLFLVHLQKPSLSPALPDKNSYAVSRSSQKLDALPVEGPPKSRR